MGKNTDLDVQERFRSLFIERKKLREKFQIINKKYALITESVNDFIAILDRSLNYEYINEDFHKNYLGYLKEDLIGLKAYSIIHPDDLNRVLEYYKKTRKDEKGKVELRVKHKDGHYFWVEVKGNRFIDVNGEPKTLLLSRDITKRKLAEKKLKKSYDTIKFYKDLFLHDMANIFTTLKMSLELISTDTSDIRIKKEALHEIIDILKKTD